MRNRNQPGYGVQTGEVGANPSMPAHENGEPGPRLSGESTAESAENSDEDIAPGDEADDDGFFWVSAVHDGPARPWRSLFR
jgi:hypothetical protein